VGWAGPVDFDARAAEVWQARQSGLRSGAAASPAVDVETDVLRWPGGARVRVRPVLDGRVVDGADAVVALDPRGGLQRITGLAPESLAADVPVRGPVGIEEALERVAVAQRRFGHGELWQPRVDARYRLHHGEVRDTWRVVFSTASPPATWVTWVDTHTGALIATEQTSHHAEAPGRVYPVSPVFGPPEVVTLTDLTSPSTLTGIYSDAWSCTDWTISDTLFAVNTCDQIARTAWQVDGGFLFRPNPPTEAVPVDPFAEVHLYHHVTEVAAYFDDRYGLRPAAPLTTIANFPMANAFFGDFDGDGAPDLSFGFVDGTLSEDGEAPSVQFAYDADVVYHEYGHWVVSRIANIPSLSADELGLDWVGGSLNEGAADIFSMVLTGDPDLGEYTGSAFSDGPIRALEGDRTCPDGIAGQVHHDGRVLGTLGWNLIERIGPEATSDVVFGAVASWGPDIDWSRAGQSLLDSAADLEAEGVLSAADVQVVEEAVAASGMVDCERIIALEPGKQVDAFVLSGGLEGELYRLPGGAQFRIEVPADAERLVLDLSDFRGVDGLGWSLYFRTDEPIAMRPTELAQFGLGFAVAETFDAVVDGDGSGRVVLDATSEPPLPAGQTLYLAVAGRDTGALELFEFTTGRMTVGAWTTRPEERAACTTLPGSGAPAGLALMGLVALSLVRRRRDAR
jgi:MYXO-CTERM domain-containing protein